MKTQVIKDAFKARELQTADKQTVWNDIIKIAAFAKIQLSSAEVLALRDEIMNGK